MHDEILSSKQKPLLSLVKTFSSKFCLIGGTAVALQLGHRRSIDFDLMTFSELKTNDIRNQIGKNYQIETVLIDETNEFTIVINGVKFTFLKYPFDIHPDIDFKEIIKMPSLLTLGAMKAYALGRRAKWKDYVDLYFIINSFTLKDLIDEANTIFGNEFNEKLFREQLAYFEDIDYTEKVDFMTGFEISGKVIKTRLTEMSLMK
ncbi:MAG: hypothetical protein UU93_C0005G0029 [Candidatus Amesbacteria bacterium GW2011_GWA2_42_12]|uniref:Uncharacterized protein n=1 Tax=Candidatus Amesbacteria bacterium GW2011_GWA2_42_12 TaxID=1618356 RepID=A0A0G1AF18_9BACT|nr:MAG: hypothetical protein UU93_C0005G0029 [Candidatus Amesbacteria bacterium GW2011_GWA2_42_12]